MARETLDINLNIAGEYISLNNIPFAEEAILRQAADQINSAWRKWSSRFADRSALHIMARVSLLFARAYLVQKEANGNVDQLLSELDSEFDRLLTSTGMPED